MKFKKYLTKIFAAALAVSVMACGSGCTGDTGSSSDDGKKDFDATKLPFYEKDVENLSYDYSDKQRIIPIWQSNVIYNEQLMIVEKDGVIQGKLLYKPSRVIAVKDATLKTEYQEGKDYVINGDVITLPEGSTIPVFKDEWSEGKNVPAAYPEGDAATGYQMIGSVIYTESSLIWGNYIHVTYAYDPAEFDRTTVKSFDDELYGLSQKIKAKENIRMTVFGDSISEGCSASKTWNHDPQCPPYATLVKEGIEEFGNISVEFTNLSVGGKDSSWAAEDVQISALSASAPDLLVLAFGTNDTYSAVESGKYRKNLIKVISAAKAVNSECQIIVIAPFPSNAKTKTDEAHENMVSELKKLVTEDAKNEKWTDICLVDMYHAVKPMLAKKNYYEIAANNINHPNDFIHRYYAMNVLSAIFDFSNYTTK